MDLWIYFAAIIPLLISTGLVILSILLLIGVIRDRRLRDIYLVFSAKFVVDIITCILIIILGILILSEIDNDPAVPFVATMVLLSQNMLLLCESYDWWTATYKPVQFHHATQTQRILPYAIGCGTVLAALIVLLVLQLQVGFPMAWLGEEIITSISFLLVLAALMIMILILRNHSETTYTKQIVLHATLCSVLSLSPMAALVVFSWLSPDIVSSDALLYARQFALFCVILHASLHSLLFYSRHNDVRASIIKFLLSIVCCVYH